MRTIVLFLLNTAFTASLALNALAQSQPVEPYSPPNGLLTPRTQPSLLSPEAAVQRPKRSVVPVPTDEQLDVNRPRAEYPALLAPKDFFGRSQRPQVQYYDPYNNNLNVDGQRSAPGDPPVIKERSAYIPIRAYSVPVINVAEETWVTLILMRDGEVVYPKSQTVGSDEIYEVFKSAVKVSPYLYLRAKPVTTDRGGNPVRTTLDIEVVDKDQQVFNYKFEIRVVPLSHPDYMPIVRVDMRNPTLPPVYGREGSRGAIAGVQTGLNAPMPQTLTAKTQSPEAPGFNVAFSTGQKFTREQTRKFLPIFIAMGKAYEEAVKAGAKGYSAREIIQFQPQTVFLDDRGHQQVTFGKVPAFQNQYDGLTYFVLRSYFFPKYDAVLYDVSFKNTSSEVSWWDYSLLGVIPGFASSDEAESPTCVTPEYGETTPSGKINELWVLVQGRGWDPSTPIRLAFPDAKMERRNPTLVLPHAETPKDDNRSPVSLLRRDETSFSP